MNRSSRHDCSPTDGALRWILILGLLLSAAVGAKTPTSGSLPKAFVPGAAEVSASLHHTCAVQSGGTVTCWGDNRAGQLGDGTRVPSGSPVDVIGISGAAAVATSYSGSCAIVADGEVKCWGNGGPLREIEGISNATAISSGAAHTCALIAGTGQVGGRVKCWGGNLVGQLGDGSTTASESAVDVVGVGDVTSIAAGIEHACAISGSGSQSVVKCWGANQTGQLGDGTQTDSPTPVTVAAVSGASALAGGEFHSCAVVGSGAIKCWGSGLLGDGSDSNNSTAVDVIGISNAAALAAGQGFSCALVAGGAVKCWGRNDAGQLGIGSTDNSPTPADVIGVNSAISLTAGPGHACAVVVGGSVPCWGGNFYGELGEGSNNSSIAVDVTVFDSGTAVAAGQFYTCALTSAGTIKCWGQNISGELGDGTRTNSAEAVDVLGVSNAIALGARFFRVCALLTDGTVKCWGGSFSLAPQTVPGVAGATALAVGVDHSCVLVAQGAVQCWGINQYGQLGDGSTTDSPRPVDVLGVRNAIALSADDDHSCALISGGTVKCWGRNEFGELGNGSTEGSTTAVDVIGVSGATAIASGASHNCAVVAGGRVKCWGNNEFGNLGNDSNANSATAVDVVNLDGVTALEAGLHHTCAAVSGGAVKCWGWNSGGQLGDGSLQDRRTPVDVSGVVSANSLAAGSYHSCAVVAGGALKCWGNGVYGQLGTGTIGYRTTAAVLQSVATNGAIANAASGKSVVSRNGSKVAFVSDASNLAADANDLRDVFIRDPQAGVTTRASAVAEAINGGALESFDDPAISDDGARIAFSGSSGQIYAAVGGLGRTVSSNANGTPGNGASGKVNLPGTGGTAFFDSQATNLLDTVDGNGSVSDIYAKDLNTGEVKLISVGPNGEPANGDSGSPWASADGQTVAFSTLATNLIADPAPSLSAKGSAMQVVASQPLARSGTIVSRNLTTSELGNGDSSKVSLTPDGRFGVFESLASNLAPGDTNNASDVFVFELSGIRLISLFPVSTSARGFGNGHSRNPSISDDGLSVTFETDATNLIKVDQNNATDVVVKSLLIGEIIRMAPTVDGLEPNGPSSDPKLSPDGKTITFTSSASNLLADDNNGVADVFTVNIEPPGGAAFQINQGISGAWFNPETSGQGVLFDIEPSSNFIFGAIFTYETAAPAKLGAPEHRWLSVQGNYQGGFAQIPIFNTSGGAFDQPVATTTEAVGSATIRFQSCTAGTLEYVLNDPPLSGSIPLQRVISGTESLCEQLSGSAQSASGNTGTGAVQPTPAGGPAFEINQGISGAWFNPQTSGQGILFDVNPATDFFFGALFTYDTAEANKLGAAEQRWFTVQGSFQGGTAQLPIFLTTGGVFDQPVPTSTTPVGTATISFESCTAGNMSYAINDPPLMGTIPLTRLLAGQALCEQIQASTVTN